MHYLKELVQMQKSGTPKGIYSACSANEYVIEACFERAMVDNDYVLIEATANQVNQFGGYTGMLPVDFREFVYGIAEKVNFPKDKIILGGDHLGPLTWKNENEQSAMEKSKELIKLFVKAGFTKIHIDTSMRVADDDKNTPLDTKVIARRAAELCKVAEEFATQEIVYVVGSEVPIPGGAQEEEEGIQVTKVADFEETVQIFKDELQGVWEKVIAVVVQPGVEFGDENIDEYNRVAATHLTSTLKKYPNLVFEGHSTDYQTKYKLKEMVEDGIAILKVGPALTFAMREGLFALSKIEDELLLDKSSNFMSVLEKVMLENPSNWKNHYHGSEDKIRLARRYSFSDRCRYYLPEKEVNTALKIMIENLKSVKIPLTLISQYMPIQYEKIRMCTLDNSPEALLKDRIVNMVDDYIFASGKEVKKC